MNPAEKMRIARQKQRELSGLSLAIGGVKVDPWFPIKIGDKVRKLEYGFDVTLLYLEEAQVNLHTTTPDLKDPRILFRLIQLGLQSHDPEFAEQIKPSDLRVILHNYYTACVLRALEMLQPDIEEVRRIVGELEALKEDEAPLATMSTASDSGPSVPHLDYQMEQ